MNVERFFYWVRLLARVILEVIPGFGDEPEAGEESPIGPGPAPEMKPERIQFWLQLIARFVMAVIAGANGETGKSGEVDG